MEQLTINPKTEKVLSRLSKQGFDIPKSKALPLREETVKEVITIIDSMFPRGSYESSYSLKHIAERILGHYVGNGEFIKAAILSGRKYQIKGINAFLK